MERITCGGATGPAGCGAGARDDADAPADGEDGSERMVSLRGVTAQARDQVQAFMERERRSEPFNGFGAVSGGSSAVVVHAWVRVLGAGT